MSDRDEDRSDELIEAVKSMAEVMPRDAPILECAEELLASQAFSDDGELRTSERRLMMTTAAYAAALRIIQELTESVQHLNTPTEGERE